jgi:hypothetical protein
LIIGAAVLDSIVKPGAVLQSQLALDGTTNAASIQEWEIRWAKLARKPQIHLAGESIEESYWRTLIANTDASGDIAKKDYAGSFDFWLKSLSEAFPQTKQEGF